jgi:HK97 family phage portal protein
MKWPWNTSKPVKSAVVASSLPNFREESGGFMGLKSVRRVGLRAGRLHYPDTDADNLISWHRRNELAYACVEKIAQTAIDPELIVETRTSPSGEWNRDDAHPMTGLFQRPDEKMNGAAFLARWLVMLHVTGTFRARIYRNDLKLPARLVPVLPPARLVPVVSLRAGTPPLYYEYQDVGVREDVAAEDVFEDKFFDPRDEYNGLAPLAVALGAVDMDAAQTEYVRAFFDNGGVPSGVIQVKNTTLKDDEAEGILARWMRKYARSSYMRGAPAVLDENAEYQRIGSNLDELESADLTERAEARVCAPFGVPPVLVGSLVGLKHQNNRASARSAQADFWDSKMSPLYKRIREHLMLTLLPEFEGRDRIDAGLVRLNWDMSQVLALQEDVDAAQKRARENLKAGGITLDEFREKVGEKPMEGGRGKVFFVPTNVKVVRADEMGKKAEPPKTLALGAPLALTEGDAATVSQEVN